jgi:hypothetical protein
LKVPAKVDAYLFAAANVGDSAFATAFNQLVNARRPAYVHDLVPQVPCTPTMAACSNLLLPQGSPTGTWAYASVGGLVPVLPQSMPVQAEVWQNFLAVFPCQATHFLSATHLCSYKCFLSQFTDDMENSCKLWESVGGEGSFCATPLAQFPITVSDGEGDVEYPFALS